MKKCIILLIECEYELNMREYKAILGFVVCQKEFVVCQKEFARVQNKFAHRQCDKFVGEQTFFNVRQTLFAF